ncbi:hypothetical protein BU16DRAFT_544591 [Lophium mytilinum]|uniref:Uncharacterized protein n=1 Tax=Lophium mytilinum TaxID=390894 RepID=A0A6A6QC05_9PEZI|nr:hypothetical protein BU16DRAFT_544591 [Lophium mytilinum]
MSASARRRSYVEEGHTRGNGGALGPLRRGDTVEPATCSLYHKGVAKRQSRTALEGCIERGYRERSWLVQTAVDGRQRRPKTKKSQGEQVGWATVLLRHLDIQSRYSVHFDLSFDVTFRVYKTMAPPTPPHPGTRAGASPTMPPASDSVPNRRTRRRHNTAQRVPNHDDNRTSNPPSNPAAVYHPHSDYTTPVVHQQNTFENPARDIQMPTLLADRHDTSARGGHHMQHPFVPEYLSDRTSTPGLPPRIQRMSPEELDRSWSAFRRATGRTLAPWSQRSDSRRAGRRISQARLSGLQSTAHTTHALSPLGQSTADAQNAYLRARQDLRRRPAQQLPRTVFDPPALTNYAGSPASNADSESLRSYLGMQDAMEQLDDLSHMSASPNVEGEQASNSYSPLPNIDDMNQGAQDQGLPDPLAFLVPNSTTETPSNTPASYGYTQTHRELPTSTLSPPPSRQPCTAWPAEPSQVPPSHQAQNGVHSPLQDVYRFAANPARQSSPYPSIDQQIAAQQSTFDAPFPPRQPSPYPSIHDQVNAQQAPFDTSQGFSPGGMAAGSSTLGSPYNNYPNYPNMHNLSLQSPPRRPPPPGLPSLLSPPPLLPVNPTAVHLLTPRTAAQPNPCSLFVPVYMPPGAQGVPAGVFPQGLPQRGVGAGGNIGEGWGHAGDLQPGAEADGYPQSLLQREMVGNNGEGWSHAGGVQPDANATGGYPQSLPQRQMAGNNGDGWSHAGGIQADAEAGVPAGGYPQNLPQGEVGNAGGNTGNAWSHAGAVQPDADAGVPAGGYLQSLPQGEFGHADGNNGEDWIQAVPSHQDAEAEVPASDAVDPYSFVGNDSGYWGTPQRRPPGQMHTTFENDIDQSMLQEQGEGEDDLLLQRELDPLGGWRG